MILDILPCFWEREMDNRFWCINVQFNPAGYKTRLNNYLTFIENLTKQNINVLTVEMTFGNQEYTIPLTENVRRLNSNSVMWQKERMINYALSQLPDECENVAWLDGDLLLPDGWEILLAEKLDKVSFVQLFQNVIHLDSGRKNSLYVKKGIIWQNKTHDDWLNQRINKKIGHAEPGFAWAAKRSALKNGLYDRLICGSGDNWLVDCLLDSQCLHHYLSKLTENMISDMENWKEHFNNDKSVDYLPIDIYHLWHGSVKDRGYHTRDLIFKQFDFDPRKDIKLVNNCWEWATDKPELHQAIINYFTSRKEDSCSGA